MSIRGHQAEQDAGGWWGLVGLVGLVGATWSDLEKNPSEGMSTRAEHKGGVQGRSRREELLGPIQGRREEEGVRYMSGGYYSMSVWIECPSCLTNWLVVPLVKGGQM